MLVAPYDGIGGARRALEILGIRPALYVSFEKDPEACEVRERNYPDVVNFGDMNSYDSDALNQLVADSGVKFGLVVGGPPCQGFSALNRNRRGFNDERSDGISKFAELFFTLRSTIPTVNWHALMENVSSMTYDDRDGITDVLRYYGLHVPYILEC